MTPPPPLSCTVCGSSPAQLRLVDLEAEQALTGIEPGTVTTIAGVVPARYGQEPRCRDCWERYREMREGRR